MNHQMVVKQLKKGWQVMKFKLSNQAIGALMMALQKGILEQIDITEILKEFSLVSTADGLVVENPPTVQAENLTEPEASVDA